MKSIPALCLVLTLLCACDQRSPVYPNREPPKNILISPAALSAGAVLFRKHCAVCHGSLEEGRSSRADFFSPPAPDFSAARYDSLDPAFLYWRIATGKTEQPYLEQGSVMPAWGLTLSETEIWNLVADIRIR